MSPLSLRKENGLETMEYLKFRFSVMQVPRSNFSKATGKTDVYRKVMPLRQKAV
jgi:hypothetical protein